LIIQEKKQDLDKGIEYIQKKYLLYLIEITVGMAFLITLLILLYSIVLKKKSDFKAEKQNNILKNKDEKITILEQKINKLEEESNLIKKSSNSKYERKCGRKILKYHFC
jgi:cell division protein FtsB